MKKDSSTIRGHNEGHAEAVVGELTKLKEDVNFVVAKVERDIRRVEGIHEVYAAALAKFATSENPRKSTSLAGLSGLGQESGLKPEDVLMMPWRVRRELFMALTSWNERLSAGGGALVAMKKLPHSSEEPGDDVGERVRRLIEAREDGGRSGNQNSLLEVDEATTRPGSLGRQKSVPVLGYEEGGGGAGGSGSGGAEDKHGDDKQRKVTAGAGAMKSAINRLFNRNNKEFDPHTIDLSELARGRPRLEPGVRGDVVLVFEDQPSTIIAYSLRSKEYHEQFRSFTDYNPDNAGRASMDSTVYDTATPLSVNKRSGDQAIEVVEDTLGGGAPGAPTSPKINRAKSLEGVQFPGGSDSPGSQKPPPLPAPSSASEERKDLERRMMLRAKTHIKHHFRDVDEKGQTLCKYVCTTYWATQFQAVRKVFLSGAGGKRGGNKPKHGAEEQQEEYRHLSDDASYVKSLATSFSWAANGGKSGASFAKTADGRFVVKCISRTELQMFLDCAPAYFEYLSKAFFHNLPTVLCKIVGVYQIGYHNRVTGKRSMEQVAVMQDIFYGRRIGKIFDLKGR